MPASTPVADFIRGKISINGPVGGFTEVYDFNFDAANVSYVRTQISSIATARAKLLAKNHAIVDVSLSAWSRTRDAYPPASYQATPELIGAEMTNPEVCNNTGLGLLFRFNTGDGKFVNRLLRGVRDSLVTDNGYTGAAFTGAPTGTILGSYTPPNTWADLLGNYLGLVRTLTSLMFFDDSNAPAVWTPYTFDSVMFRRVGSRDLGKRIGVSRGRQASMA